MAVSKTNLIVNQLPLSMTDDEFGDLFAQIGPIRSHNIIKNKTTKESLGYGFVDFRKEEDAERALSELHSSEINGKILKIQYARKNHTPKGTARIFVSKLPAETTEPKLRELFEEFGEIVEVQMPLKSDGCAKGYAFITYQEEMDAKASIEALNLYSDDFFTQPIGVKISVSDQSIQAEKKKVQRLAYENATVQNPTGTGQPDYHTATSFPGHEAMKRGVPMYDLDPSMIPPPPPKRKKPSAENTMGNFESVYQPQKVVLPEVPPNSDGVTLFFYNIGKDTDEDQMKKVLLNQGVGAMLCLTIVRNPATQASKNFAFVKFRNTEDAQQTIATLHRTDLFGCGPVEIKFKTYSVKEKNGSNTNGNGYDEM